MAQSAIARFTRSIRRRCMARPAGAALLTLALGGAVAGGAMALSPTVDTALVFRGGVNIVRDNLGGGTQDIYVVPAGRKFMLTDLVIANNSATSPAAHQQVWTATGANCADGGTLRTSRLTVPAGGTLHLPFVTGIGFAAGQLVCIFNGEVDKTTNWTIRGYLFE
jgi:hypothetical protein